MEVKRLGKPQTGSLQRAATAAPQTRYIVNTVLLVGFALMSILLITQATKLYGDDNPFAM
jgi:hypothetical protein